MIIRKLHSLTELTNQIEAEADAIDIASTPSKTEEMHRLFDDACNSLIAALVFCKKIGVTTLDGQYPMDGHHALLALNSMLRNKDGKRFVQGVRNGNCTPIDVDDLDLVNAVRLAYANHLGVPEQTVIRFEKTGADTYGFERLIKVHCNHPGCSASKGIGFDNPTEMLKAEQRAAKEIWYCHHHREFAFANEGAISDELLPVLQRIRQSPGLTQKATEAKKEDIVFLEAVGLIRVDQNRHGSRVLHYQIFITKEGRRLLDKLLHSDCEE